MDEYDCTKMVYSSSATVYGTPPTIPIPETTRLKADSPYGKTKVMSETVLEDLCSGEFDFCDTIAGSLYLCAPSRCPKLCGPRYDDRYLVLLLTMHFTSRTHEVEGAISPLLQVRLPPLPIYTRLT